MQTRKGAVAGFVALVACPCHLPLTIPLLLLLISGTAAGVWLAANQWFIWLASTAIFAAGLALAWLWLRRAAADGQCELPQNRQQSTSGTVEAGGSHKRLDLSHQTKEVSHV